MRKIYYLIFSGALALLAACSSGNPTAEAPKPAASEKSIKDLQLPSGIEGSGASAVDDYKDAPQTAKKDPAAQLAEGSGTSMDKGHPQVSGEEKREREVVVPNDIKGKWKAVKILVKNKKDESRNEIKLIDLGKHFTIAGAGLTVTVGPFFPNFVMNESRYTSMDNSLINPAVQLVVEEKGKIIYKGWAFERYPTLYAFEHDTYALQLVDFVPADIS